MLPLLMGSVCHAEDVTIRFDGTKAKVKNKEKDSVTVAVNGACVSIESLYKTHKLTLRLSGKSDDGQLVLKTAGKAKVTLDGLTLTSQEGAPLWLKNKKKVEVKAVKGTVNTLTITACTDTANHKGAVIWAKDKLLLSGKGVLNIVATGDGCRGIKTQKDVTIEELTLNVTTSGNNLGEKPFGFGGFGGGFPPFGNDSTGFGGFPGGFPPFGNDSIGFGGFPGGFPSFGNDSTGFGGFPMPNFGDGFPEFKSDSIGFPGGFPSFGNDSIGFPGGFPPFGNDSIGFGGGFPSFGNDSTGFGGKHKYYASAKGIASKGKITINSGDVTVRTATAGAEGIEGKQGIVFNGGTVDVLSPDDAINANATIEFNGAHVTAHSRGNDAVDANPAGGFFPPFGGGNEQKIEPAIIIRGGTVYAWSQVGPPEEGLDSDMAPIAIEGGTVFSVGGSIGDAPSVPTNETAKQPTVLLTNLNITKDEPVNILDADGRLIHSVSIPFSFRRSATLVTCPAFKVGSTYTVKAGDYENTFTLTEPFTIVR